MRQRSDPGITDGAFPAIVGNSAFAFADFILTSRISAKRGHTPQKVVAIITEQQPFAPVIDWVLGFRGSRLLAGFYLVNGALPRITDHVFVATVYMGETLKAFNTDQITRSELERLAVATRTGPISGVSEPPMGGPPSCFY